MKSLKALAIASLLAPDVLPGRRSRLRERDLRTVDQHQAKLRAAEEKRQKKAARRLARLPQEQRL